MDALNSCMMIDANMTVYDREPMRHPRFGTATALIRDRFALVLGGFLGKNRPTNFCELYDT